VAVAAGNTVLCERHVATVHGQTELLLPMVDDAMREAGFPASALDLVAVTIGPGSFTGVRVGIAAARGIALGLELPLLGVTGFEAAIHAADLEGDGRWLLAALESRREDLYVQFFDPAHRPFAVPAAVMPEALAAAVTAAAGARPLAILGDAAARAAAALAGRRRTTLGAGAAPVATGVARAALRRWRQGEHSSPTRPLYLRPPDVTLAAEPRRPAGS
jgi:tRNA threonylcarbamoyladenosine biosynthesis protein TsaB